MRSDDRIIEVATHRWSPRGALIAIMEEVIDEGRVRMRVVRPRGDVARRRHRCQQPTVGIDLNPRRCWRSAVSNSGSRTVPAVRGGGDEGRPRGAGRIEPNDEFLSTTAAPMEDFASLVQDHPIADGCGRAGENPARPGGASRRGAENGLDGQIAGTGVGGRIASAAASE